MSDYNGGTSDYVLYGNIDNGIITKSTIIHIEIHSSEV